MKKMLWTTFLTALFGCGGGQRSAVHRTLDFGRERNRDLQLGAAQHLAERVVDHCSRSIAGGCRNECAKRLRSDLERQRQHRKSQGFANLRGLWIGWGNLDSHVHEWFSYFERQRD